MQKECVWIVHETVHMLMLLRNAIAQHGYFNVKCFLQGEDALALMKEGEKPHLIIAKEKLPGISGNDLLGIASTIGEYCKGILLVSSETNPYAYAHHTIIEGSAGFHESLLQTVQLVMHKGYQASSEVMDFNY